MENNEKFDFIKEKLNENTEEMPLSLRRENVVSSLDNIGKNNIKHFPKRRIVSLAASVAIVLISVLVLNFINGSGFKTKDPQAKPPETSEMGASGYDSQEPDENEALSQYKDIINYFKSKSEAIKLSTPTMTVAEINGFEAPASSAENFDSIDSFTYNKGEVTESSDASYGQTNTQVSGIDEADIIKNDGTYLYILRSSRRVAVYRASDLKLMSEIVLPDVEGKERSGVNEMYLSGERLVIISTVYDENNETASSDNEVFYYYRPAYFRTSNAETETLIYDISSTEEPKLIFTRRQSGDYNTSRLIGNVLYNITRYTVMDYVSIAYDYSESKAEEKVTDEDYFKKYIPEIDGKKISRSDIDFFKDSDAMGYVVVSSCDITKDKSEGAAYAYLGNADDVYCTKDTLYLSNVIYTDDISGREAKSIKKEFNLDDGWHTHIYAVSLSDSSIKSKGDGYVRGEFINQFAMDEYNGYFRCATTYRDKNWKAVSSVIILDKDFKEVSRVDDLADNEEIKSVRFMGDIAYVVTFRNTDPLFVLDLSDPTSPKKDGEVKLPGFSSYLHPIGDSYIVGVGYGGTNSGIDGSVQITLFDVSDKKNPVVSSSYKINDVDTELNESRYNNNSFKAFLYYPEKNIIGIPLEKWNSDDLIREYVLFRVENGELKLVNQYRHEKIEYNYDDIVIFNSTSQINDPSEDFSEFFRGTYINNTLYTISENRICAFDIESADKLCEVEIKK